MSLYGIMRTSTSGMAAQAGRLATVADNIANVNTNGYKRAFQDFSSLLIDEAAGNYTSGAVLGTTRHAISQQGSLLNTASLTDLAISGEGFFVVSNAAGQPFLTRSGSFVKNEVGELINTAGFKLMGYPLNGQAPGAVANGFQGLVPVSLSSLALQATASTTGTFTANLPSNAAVTPAASLPSANAATATFAGKSSLVTYDNLGNEVILDVYYSKTAASTWEAAVYNQADATNGGFPYTSAALSVTALTFNPANGQLTSPTALSAAIPNGATLTLDISQMSQLATSYTVTGANVDGNPPSAVDLLEISRDGTFYAIYENGSRAAVFRVPLATVNSPDNLTPLTGNVFQATKDSGDVVLGTAETANYGSILAGTLEESTVDLANELTTMIDSQRGYSANSKVFQTGAELMDVLINLKR
jgi:flagellar hook protein FlgE